MAFLDLSDLKTELDITGSTHDAALTRRAAAAEAAVVGLVGPVEPTTVTENVRATGGALVLTTLPVLELTSVVGQAVGALTVSDLFLSAGGVVLPTYGGSIPDDWYAVEYLAGRGDPPSAIYEATLVIAKHLWATRRGPASARANMDMASVGGGFAIPRQALEMLDPYILGPGVG